MQTILNNQPCRSIARVLLQVFVLWLFGSTSIAQSPANWSRVLGAATDIAVNAKGDVWAIANVPANGDHYVYRLANNRWIRIPGEAVRIAVDPAGNAWTVSADGRIRRYNGFRPFQVPGLAMDIAVGANGAVWIIGKDQSISQFIPSTNKWNKIQGAAIRIAVDASGDPWVVNSVGQIYHRKGATWNLYPGSAKDIGVDATGVVYIVGTTPSAGGYSIQRSQGTMWVNDGAAGISVAAGPSGVAYVTKDASAANGIAARQPSPLTAGLAPALAAATPIVGSATTITIPPPKQTTSSIAQPGSTAITVPSAPILVSQPQVTVVQPTTPVVVSPPQSVQVTNPTTVIPITGQMTLTQTAPSAVIASPQGTITTGGPASSTSGSLVVGQPTLTLSSAPLTVTGKTWVPPSGNPPASPSWYQVTPGSLLCSDPEASGRCGNTDAGYIGGYKLNTSCSEGFYDMVTGGTCWKCPSDDDNRGAWIRSADPVSSDTACWRAPKEQLASAIWVKYGMSWDCSGDQFWDATDKSKTVHGSCWRCPTDNPRRTSYAVQDSRACASAIGNQTARATFVKYNGCSAADASTIYPNDRRLPGVPFLDIASGLSVANNSGGACWECPVADEQGNYFFTERNPNTLIGRKTGNNGCTVKFRYKPSVFHEPGLSGLGGVSQVLMEQHIFERPAALTLYLYSIAHARHMSNADAKAWVAKQWSEIATHPFRNSAIRALVLQYVLGTAPDYTYASGSRGARTPGQALLILWLQRYIQLRKIYIAQEALNMYHDWKVNVDAQRNSHAQSQLVTLFYYGTVPIDFQSVVAAVVVPTASAAGVIGTVALANTYAGAIEWTSRASAETGELLWATVRSTTMFGITAAEDGLLAGMAAAPEAVVASMIGGPVTIAFAGATLAAMAIQQVVQMEQAEPTLLAALAKAKTEVSLDEMLKQKDGADQASYFWGLATGVNDDADDPQIVTLASNAYGTAQQTAFAAPSGPPPPFNSGGQAKPVVSAVPTASGSPTAEYRAASTALLNMLASIVDLNTANAARAGLAAAVQRFDNAKSNLALARHGAEKTVLNTLAPEFETVNQQIVAQATRLRGLTTIYPAVREALVNLDTGRAIRPGVE